MKKTLRKMIMAVLTISFLLLPCAVSASAAGDTAGGVKEINVYNWGEYISIGEDELMDVNKEFEKRTGIKVNYNTFDTNESLYAKLKSSGASYDVIIPSDYMISKMINEDMLSELDFNNIPNYSLIDDRFKTDCEYDPSNKYSVPYTWGRVGIFYNSEVVTETVDSWDILWNEKYKKQILMIDNPRDAFGIAQKKLGYSFNSTNTGEWDKATEELKAQKSILQAYVMDQIFDKLSSGEAAIAPYYSGDALTIYDNNDKIKFAVPKEGTNLFVDAMCIPKNCSNKAGAEAYINFMCETDVASDNISYISYSSPQIEAAEQHKEYLTDKYGQWAVDIVYPVSTEGCETFAALPDNINKLMDESWIQITGSGDSTVAIIAVISVLLALVIIAVLLRVRKNCRERNL